MSFNNIFFRRFHFSFFQIVSAALVVLFTSNVNANHDASRPAATAPLYSQSEVGKMIPLKLMHAYDSFELAIGGSAINGINPDKSLDVFLDTGSTILVVPEDYVNPSKVKVLQSCVVDYWGNIDDLVQGQITLKSTDKSVSYSVNSYVFYRVRNITNPCASTTGGTPNSSPYFKPDNLQQLQLIMGIGTGLSNPTYNSKQYCIGGFFNFLSYSKYSATNNAIFSLVSFGNGLTPSPNPESLIPFSMQSYINVGVSDRGGPFNYTPMLKSAPNYPCASSVQSSWAYWDRAPATIVADNVNIQTQMFQTPTGSEPNASTVPYAAVDTGGGRLAMVDAPGNPSLIALTALGDLEVSYPATSTNLSCNGVQTCYCLKAGLPITVQLPSTTAASNISYAYNTMPTSWGSYGAYQVVICENGTNNTSFNLGFPLFYAANTVSFDFTNQRIGVSLGQITPPSTLPLPNFFCSTWQKQYGIIPFQTWGTAPVVIRSFWDDYDCDDRILNPTKFLFH